MSSLRPPLDPIAEIGAAAAGPHVGAFFDLDGTSWTGSPRPRMPATGFGAGKRGSARWQASSRRRCDTGSAG